MLMKIWERFSCAVFSSSHVQCARPLSNILLLNENDAFLAIGYLLIAAITDARSTEPISPHYVSAESVLTFVFVENIVSFQNQNSLCIGRAECENRSISVFFASISNVILMLIDFSQWNGSQPIRMAKNETGKLENNISSMRLLTPHTNIFASYWASVGSVAVECKMCIKSNILTNHPLEIHLTFSFQFAHQNRIASDSEIGWFNFRSEASAVVAAVNMSASLELCMPVFVTSFRQPSHCWLVIHILRYVSSRSCADWNKIWYSWNKWGCGVFL